MIAGIVETVVGGLVLSAVGAVSVWAWRRFRDWREARALSRSILRNGGFEWIGRDDDE